MAVLVQLSRGGGEVVEKRALMDAVWGSTVVSEDVLTQAIVELRRAFGDDARNPTVIETIHRVGFRLLPEVRAASAAHARPVRWRTVVVVGVFAVGAGLVYWLAGPSGVEFPSGSNERTVAVLPFENLSPNPEDAYFAAGIHDEILNQLGKVGSLSVIARTSVLRYAEERPSIQQIARELGVGAVMEGTVRYADDRVRISAQLIDAGTGTHLWSNTYERGFGDIFAIESDIAISIAKALEAEFSAAERERIESAPTSSPAAYALYLRVLQGSGSGEQAVENVERAIALDPDFAAAHAVRAAIYAYGTVLAAEQEQTIRESAERALELDPTLGFAHAALGNVHRSRWRWAEARAAFQRAVELGPNQPRILEMAGRVSRYMGEYAEAVRFGRRAVELDPKNFVLHYQLGISLRYAGRHDAAYAAFESAIDLQPAFAAAHMQRAFVEISRGNHEDAASKLRVAEELFIRAFDRAFQTAQLALAYAQLGRREDVTRLFSRIEELGREKPIDEAVWALAYIASGDYEKALALLERAFQEQAPDSILALSEIKANAYQDPVLETDPRFVAARAMVGAH